MSSACTMTASNPGTTRGERCPPPTQLPPAIATPQQPPPLQQQLHRRACSALGTAATSAQLISAGEREGVWNDGAGEQEAALAHVHGIKQPFTCVKVELITNDFAQALHPQARNLAVRLRS
eukprot:1152076-Pelagomonas_calceolata.AAC.2